MYCTPTSTLLPSLSICVSLFYCHPLSCCVHLFFPAFTLSLFFLSPAVSLSSCRMSRDGSLVSSSKEPTGADSPQTGTQIMQFHLHVHTYSMCRSYSMCSIPRALQPVSICMLKVWNSIIVLSLNLRQTGELMLLFVYIMNSRCSVFSCLIFKAS